MKIKVGLASCSIAAGAQKVYDALSSLAAEDVQICKAGCLGLCYLEPLIEVYDDEGKRFLYGNVTEKTAAEIYNSHAQFSREISKYLVSNGFSRQERLILARCGEIDPESLDEAMALGAYEGLKNALAMTPDEVIETMKASGLRGRGGAGFPTGVKWSLARASKGDEKFVICNADEGDPGAFMDRSILESDPHAVIEGLAIAGFAVGAGRGIIYVRAEYPLAVKRLGAAIKQAAENGILGKDIFDSGFDFTIEIKQGAGAFVCGEETAMIASIEGGRGMPRIRPPYPAERGLFGKPSNINNVETLAAAAFVMNNGAAAYAAHGTDESAGTKVFALAGKVQNGGLYEVPFGMTVRDLIFEVGGGVRGGKGFKAVQMGGPSGGCLPEEKLDTEIGYAALSQTGAIVGSGGVIVLDETSCMVDLAKYFLAFTQDESCGKCTFCRIGTTRMLEILTRITNGEGEADDVQRLEELAMQVKENALCGLGQTAPNPVLTTIKYFKNEYYEHIYQKKCSACACTSLINYSIDEEKCTGCTACSRACPAGAITGAMKEKHIIDTEKCTKCGTCLDRCRFGAILVQ